MKYTHIFKAFIQSVAVATAMSGAVFAQSADAKRDLAVRIINAQDGAEMERMFGQLANTVVQPAVERWSERLSQLPANKQQSTTATLEVELKKFDTDVVNLITAEAAKARRDALPATYVARFSEDELKQLAALMEAPVFKKYQTIAPELGSAFIKTIVEGARAAVEARVKSFDDTAGNIVGGVPSPAPASAQPPAAAPKKKP